MPKIVICLDKYSDYLEAYSAVVDYSNYDIHCYFVENERNTVNSVKSIFSEIDDSRQVEIIAFTNKAELFKHFFINDCELFNAGDIFVAPFIRYRDLWKMVPELRNKNILTIHISECLPDSFGHLGYRLGFRGNNLKSWLTLPFAKIYAITHKPDKCYFPMFPEIRNSFVKETLPVLVPTLSKDKKQTILNLCKQECRPLLITGFGYDLEKMLSSLNLKKFIATSKNKEIIIDGNTIPLDYHICAEEVLLSGLVTEIIGYNSTAIVWAKKLYPDIPIHCFESLTLKKSYGFLYNILSKKSLQNIGINLLPENKSFVN